MGGTKLIKNKEELTYLNCSNANEGRITWPREDEIDLIANNHYENAGFAVITTPEYQKEAEEKFGEFRVYTKFFSGLEFSHVLLYRFFQTEGWEEISKISIDKDFELSDNPSQSTQIKNDFGSFSFGYYYNNFYTAVTRSSKELMIFQPTKNNNAPRNIVNLLELRQIVIKR